MKHVQRPLSTSSSYRSMRPELGPTVNSGLPGQPRPLRWAWSQVFTQERVLNRGVPL